MSERRYAPSFEWVVIGSLSNLVYTPFFAAILVVMALIGGIVSEGPSGFMAELRNSDRSFGGIAFLICFQSAFAIYGISVFARAIEYFQQRKQREAYHRDRHFRDIRERPRLAAIQPKAFYGDGVPLLPEKPKPKPKPAPKGRLPLSYARSSSELLALVRSGMPKALPEKPKPVVRTKRELLALLKPRTPLPAPAPRKNAVHFDIPRTVLKKPVPGRYAGGLPKTFPFLVQDYFEFFNQALFEGQLKPCAIVVRKINGKDDGFDFDPGGLARSAVQANPQWIQLGHEMVPLEPGEYYDLIELDLVYVNCTDYKNVLALLVHEMCHVIQHHHAPRDQKRGHTKYWSDLMLRIGLRPYSTDPDGKPELRVRVWQEIIKGGLFDQAADHLLAHWDSAGFPPLDLKPAPLKLLPLNR